MKKLSIQRLSVVSIVLLAASAVTAAIIPSNKKDSTFFGPQSITASNDGAGQSCSTTESPTVECINTVSGSFGISGSTGDWFGASHSNQTTD